MKFKTAKGKTIEKRSLVYELDPAARETFSEQLAENLRRAISNGQFKAGEILPGVRSMAALCGTSVRVPIKAMKSLAEEGFVRARPRIGCVVLGRNRRVWHGSILLLHVGWHSNYSQNAFANELSIRFESANWRVDHVFVPRRDGTGDYDMSFLEKRLTERHDLVILPAFDPPVIDAVKSSGLLYMLINAPPGEKKGHCVGTLLNGGNRRALNDFANHCRRSGIRRILQVAFNEGGVVDFSTLMAEDVTVENIVVAPDVSPLRVESFAHYGYCALLERLRKRRAPIPDLIYFNDDYLACGGFCALRDAGLRVPADVKVVSFTNYGNSPFFPRPITRIEHDPYGDADGVVRAALRFLKTGRFAGTVIGSVRYVRGETF